MHLIKIRKFKKKIRINLKFLPEIFFLKDNLYLIINLTLNSLFIFSSTNFLSIGHSWSARMHIIFNLISHRFESFFAFIKKVNNKL